jgi:hypothetical protein
MHLYAAVSVLLSMLVWTVTTSDITSNQLTRLPSHIIVEETKRVNVGIDRVQNQTKPLRNSPRTVDAALLNFYKESSNLFKYLREGAARIQKWETAVSDEDSDQVRLLRSSHFPKVLKLTSELLYISDVFGADDNGTFLLSLLEDQKKADDEFSNILIQKITAKDKQTIKLWAGYSQDYYERAIQYFRNMSEPVLTANPPKPEPPKSGAPKPSRPPEEERPVASPRPMPQYRNRCNTMNKMTYEDAKGCWEFIRNKGNTSCAVNPYSVFCYDKEAYVSGTSLTGRYQETTCLEVSKALQGIMSLCRDVDHGNKGTIHLYGGMKLPRRFITAQHQIELIISTGSTPTDTNALLIVHLQPYPVHALLEWD